MAPRYESGGEAQALVRPARDRGLPLPKIRINLNKAVINLVVNEVQTVVILPRAKEQGLEQWKAVFWSKPST